MVEVGILLDMDRMGVGKAVGKDYMEEVGKDYMEEVGKDCMEEVGKDCMEEDKVLGRDRREAYKLGVYSHKQ